MDGVYELLLTAFAIFRLEECFGSEPEFRRFFDAVEPLVNKTIRKIVVIRKAKYTHKDKISQVLPKVEECEILWPLLERWEDTGHYADSNELQSLMRQIYEAHQG